MISASASPCPRCSAMVLNTARGLALEPAPHPLGTFRADGTSFYAGEYVKFHSLKVPVGRRPHVCRRPRSVALHAEDTGAAA